MYNSEKPQTMTSVDSDINELLRELIDTVINNSIIEVSDNPEVQGDETDIDDAVNALLEEILGAVCDVNPKLMAGDGDMDVIETTNEVSVAETPAEDGQRERVGDELDRKDEAEKLPTANHKAPRGRSRRIMAATWKGVRRVTRLLLCGCFRGE